MAVQVLKSRVIPVKRRLVGDAKRWLSRFMPYQASTADQTVFDAEYANGAWQCLRSVTELPRFSVITGYCQYYKPLGAILDIGCGEGILQESLGPARYQRYVGVDFSQEAIQLARPKQDEKTSFVHADARTYVPAAAFDVIIFNECLYYFADPLAVVRRYEPFLAPNGIYIVSMFAEQETVRTKFIWKMLAQVYPRVAETMVSTRARHRWFIKVFTPSRANV